MCKALVWVINKWEIMDTFLKYGYFFTQNSSARGQNNKKGHLWSLSLFIHLQSTITGNMNCCYGLQWWGSSERLL